MLIEWIRFQLFCKSESRVMLLFSFCFHPLNSTVKDPTIERLVCSYFMEMFQRPKLLFFARICLVILAFAPKSN